MSTEPLPEALPERTVRFRLRTLIIATTAAALLAALAGVVYRQAVPAARAELLTFWGAASFIAAGQIATAWWRAYRLTRIAGPKRYQLRRPDLPRLRFGLFSIVTPLTWFSMLGVLWGGLLFATNTLWLTQSRLERVDSVLENAIGGVIVGSIICGSMSVLWHRYVRRRWMTLCDYGVAIEGRVLPWDSLVRAWWHFMQPTWLMISTWTRPYAAEVPTHAREAVEAFVRARCVFDDADDGSEVARGNN
jgi:hypothetical protein